MIGLADHFDFEAFGFEEFFQADGEFYVVVCLGADAVGGSGVFAAMACIEDDGAEVACVADEVWAEDGIDEFGKIHAGYVDAVS